MSAISNKHQIHSFAYFFPEGSRKEAITQLFIRTLLPFLNQQWYLNTDRILHKIRSFKDQMKMETYEKCLNATQKYLNSRDFSVSGRYEVKKSWFFSGIQSYGETPRFQQLNSGLKALLKEVQPHKASWSESFRACWNGFIDCCSSAVSYTYNNPGKTACTFLALETTIFAVRSYQQNSTFDASTSIVPWGNSPESHWSCGSNLVFGLSGTLLTQNPIFITAAGASCMPMAFGQIVSGQIQDQLLNVGDPFSMKINMTELFGESVTNVTMSQMDGSMLPAWLHAKTVSGSFSTTNALDVKVLRGLAYVVNGEGLKIIDVRDSTNPTFVSAYPILRTPYRVTVSGNIAYLANGESGLGIVNISDSHNPTSISKFKTTDAREIFVSGNLAYVADWIGGLKIIDISDSANPVSKGSLNVWARGVSVSDNFAYIASSNGLRIIDVSNATEPYLTGTLQTVFPWKLTTVGHLVYLADNEGGLKIIDVSNSTNPFLTGSLATVKAWDVVVRENFAYVADGAGGLKIINISDSTNPILVSEFPTTDARGITVNGNYAYVADDTEGLKIIDLAFWEMYGIPVISKQKYHLLVTANNLINKVSKDFFLSTDHFPKAFIPLSSQSMLPGKTLVLNWNVDNLFQDKDVDDTLGLRIMLLNDPTYLPKFIQFKAKPLMQSSIATSQANQVAIDGNLAYVADGSSLKIIDVSDSADPILIGSCPTYNAGGIAVRGNLAYVADGLGGGLKIINVSDSAHPAVIAESPTVDALRVDVSGHFAYVADYTGGLRIFDVSDSAHPSQKRTFPTYMACSVAVDENLAYLADGRGGSLKIIDVSDSDNPTLRGEFPTAIAKGVVIAGKTAYLADNEEGLKIINVSNSTHPVLKGIFPATAKVMDVAVSGNTAYMIDIESLKIIDVSNSSKPILESNFVIARANGVTVRSNLAYIADDVEGLKIIDLTNYQFAATPTHDDEGNYDLVVTATDSLLATASTTFTLRVEGAPRLRQPLPYQIAIVGQSFSTFVPEGTFWDPNNDIITYSSGQLPSFLKFNPASATLGGIPDVPHPSEYNITIFATDRITNPTPANWTLFVHHAPTLNKPLSDRAVDIGQPFSFLLDPLTFTHKDSFPLTYKARKENQDPLPSRFYFDSQTLTFSGTPEETDKGDLAIEVEADDGMQGKATGSFHLAVEHFPRLTKQVPRIYTAFGHAFTFDASSYFIDIDGESLQFSAISREDTFKNFDSLNCIFSRTFSSSEKGDNLISLTARDPKSGFVTAMFNISVLDYGSVLSRHNPSEVSIDNRAPQLVVPLTQQRCTAGERCDFAIKASFQDPDEDTLRFTSDSGRPSWLTLDSIEGKFFGTPSSSDAAIYSTRHYTVGVTAMDPANKTVAGSFEILLEGPSLAEKVISALLAISGAAVATWGYYQKKYLLWNWFRKKQYQQPDLYVVVGETGTVIKIGYAADKIKYINVITVKDRCCVKKDSCCPDVFKRTETRTFQGGAKAYLFDWLFYDPKTNQFQLIEKGPDERHLEENIQIQIRGTDDRIMEQYTVKVGDKEAAASAFASLSETLSPTVRCPIELNEKQQSLSVAVDAENPNVRLPISTSSLSSVAASTVVAISSNIAYVADSSGLRIVNVSNSAHPILKSSLPTSASADRSDQQRIESTPLVNSQLKAPLLNQTTS